MHCKRNPQKQQNVYLGSSLQTSMIVLIASQLLVMRITKLIRKRR